ncbi:MAG TPA: hypothetical protein VM597_30665 [Gemmataceae bacterium]|jgi:hypothetical protein|nr:hypothetical protein [Gemmataceae bacterium]
MFDADDLPPPPTLSPEVYDRLRQTIADRGPAAAVDRLCADLRALGDLNALFYALLMKKRVELGVSPFPTGAAADLPKETHAEYEDAIRSACRFIGTEFLKRNDLRKAWTYFDMLGEPGPVREYIENLDLTDAEDVQPVVEVALYHGVHPTRGFDIVVQKYGICNAITTYSGQDFSRTPGAKQHAIKALVRSLYDQLLERLKTDLEGRGKPVPTDATVGGIVKAHPELFEDGAYHIDTSHLSSVAQFALELDPGPERLLAREFCEYGERLGEGLRYGGDAPFEKSYADYKVLLETLDGVNVEAGLKHFRDKIDREVEVGNTFPAEVYVNLLLKLDRKDEALAVAKKYLGAETRQLSCPSVYDLCQQAGDYEGLAAAAKARNDGVQFLAGLIAGRR